MKALLVSVLGAALLSVAAEAPEPTPLAPYRLSPPPESLTQTDRLRAELYRDQLRRRLGQLEERAARDALELPERREIPAVRGELDRMNEILRR